MRVLLLHVATQDRSFCILVLSSLFLFFIIFFKGTKRFKFRRLTSSAALVFALRGHVRGHPLTNTFPVSQRNCVTETPFVQTKITVDTLTGLCVLCVSCVGVCLVYVCVLCVCVCVCVCACSCKQKQWSCFCDFFGLSGVDSDRGGATPMHHKTDKTLGV